MNNLTAPNLDLNPLTDFSPFGFFTGFDSETQVFQGGQPADVAIKGSPDVDFEFSFFAGEGEFRQEFAGRGAGIFTIQVPSNFDKFTLAYFEPSTGLRKIKEFSAKKN